MNRKVVVILMAGTLLLGGVATGAVWAADSNKALTTQVTRMNRFATSKGQTVVTNRTATDFSSFYGQDNSQALATGLRSGKEITLTSQATDGTISTTTFTPPTGKMGNGEVYISMALAQQRLTAAGITQPTAQQMQTAMMGGTFTTDGKPVQGVLQMRASGMGWGQIAQAYGTKLGPVISGMKAANTALSRTTVRTGTTTTGTTTTTAVGKGGTTTGAGKSGIVTGAGGEANVVGGPKGSEGKSGIVTGAGGAAGGAPSAAGAAGSRGQGAGVVTGGGGAAGGGGQGQGNAYGRGGK